LAFPLSALAGLVIAGCPDDQTLIHPPTEVPDATTTDSGPGPDTQAHVRFAHLAPGAGAVDLCIAAVAAPADAGVADSGPSDADGGNADAGAIDSGVQDSGSAEDSGSAQDSGSGEGLQWFGPILAGQGITGGIHYPEVTVHLPLPAVGNIVARLVNGGAKDCTSDESRLRLTPGGPAVADITTGLPPINAGDVVSVVAAEKVTAQGPQLAPSVFVDHSASDSGKAGVRFINAAVGSGNLDFGLVSGGNFQAIAPQVAFGATSFASDGYFQLNPVSGTGTGARVQSSPGSTPTEVTKDFSPFTAVADSLTTVFAIGTLLSGDPTHPFTVLVCQDNGQPVADAGPDSHLTNCAAPASVDAGH